MEHQDNSDGENYVEQSQERLIVSSVIILIQHHNER